MQVVEELIKGIVAGFMELFESSGKISHIMHHSFLISEISLFS